MRTRAKKNRTRLTNVYGSHRFSRISQHHVVLTNARDRTF